MTKFNIIALKHPVTMELNDSHLGQKEYWDKVYVTELDNFKNNQDDVGKQDLITL